MTPWEKYQLDLQSSDFHYDAAQENAVIAETRIKEANANVDNAESRMEIAESMLIDAEVRIFLK